MCPRKADVTRQARQMSSNASIYPKLETSFSTDNSTDFRSCYYAVLGRCKMMSVGEPVMNKPVAGKGKKARMIA